MTLAEVLSAIDTLVGAAALLAVIRLTVRVDRLERACSPITEKIWEHARAQRAEELRRRANGDSPD